MAISESTHWYDKDGQPAYQIQGANGKMRPPTLRDARKLDLAPSVTTIIGIAAKPALENWKIDQALYAALTLPKNENESLDDFMARAKRDSKDQAIKAAERGTEIHAQVESGFAIGLESTPYLAVREKLDGLFPGMNWKAEDSFTSLDGYGGKVDLYGDGVVVDFKTKDYLRGKSPKSLVYDEHGMQLSAYAHGLGMGEPARVSVFIDRKETDLVLAYVHDPETHKKHIAMFLHLLRYWQESRGYHPFQAVA